MKPRFSLGAVLALALAAPLAAAAAQPPVCAKPEWPQEARRYELEGVTTLKFKIDPQGRPIEPAVARSSNWALLDQASIQALSTCVFPAETVQRVQGKSVPLQFVWKLEGASRVPPAFMEGSCAPSDRFARFVPFDRRADGPDGVLVRLLVGGDGVPYGVKAEASGIDPELAQAAIAYAQSCRFAYPKTGGVPGSPVAGRVELKR